jgi:hypothetical protein
VNVCTRLSSKWGPVAGFCEYCHELSGSVIVGNFLTQLNNLRAVIAQSV